MRNTFLFALAFVALGATAQRAEITGSFNASKPILPSSQYTSQAPYTASVWVLNEGRRYDGAYHNHIWGEPQADENGRQWYEPEYVLTDGGGADWQTASAPFSSDEYYKDHKSFRWVTVDITADIYMRRSFTLSELPGGMIYLACGHDDAPAEWYINGTLVHSVADGWNNDEYHLLSDEHKALIKTDGSENILAVHVHQNYGGAFADCGLYEADMRQVVNLLPTLEKGPWPCKAYTLNYNSDLEAARAARWYSLDEDESDWLSTVGPMSNDENMFAVTEWPSQVRPILIRRHFDLSAEELVAALEGNVQLSCSYDENPKIYLNGTLIWSANGWNDNDYAFHSLTDDQRKLLRAGDNVLAVSLMQGGGGGHIDYGLQISAPYEVSGIVLPGADAVATADSRVFNLFGQYMGERTDGLPAGVYVTGGKKVYVK